MFLEALTQLMIGTKCSRISVIMTKEENKGTIIVMPEGVDDFLCVEFEFDKAGDAAFDVAIDIAKYEEAVKTLGTEDAPPPFKPKANIDTIEKKAEAKKTAAKAKKAEAVATTPAAPAADAKPRVVQDPPPPTNTEPPQNPYVPSGDDLLDLISSQ